MTLPALESSAAEVAVIPPRPRGLSIATVNDALELAKHLSESGLVPKDYIGNPGAIVAAIDLGLSVGLSAMQACQGIANINGRPSLWGDAAIAVVMAHPDFFDIDEDAPDVAVKSGGRCKITRRRKDGTAKEVERRFSYTEATEAGLIGGKGKENTWGKYPGRMLQMRARAFAMRDAFPDALKGLSVAEEAQDFEIIATATPGTDILMPRSKSGAPAPGPRQTAPSGNVHPAPAANGHGKALTVIGVDQKQSGTGKTFYIITLRQGQEKPFEASTFSKSHAAMASELRGRLAYVETETKVNGDRTYVNVTTIEPYADEREPGQEG